MKKFTLILFLVSSFLVGCTDNLTSQQYIDENNIQGVGIGLEIEAEKLSTYRYQIDNDEVIAKIFLDNQLSKENDYKFFIMVDYEVVNFEYNGKTIENAIITLPPYTSEDFTVKLNPLEPGIRDILLVVVRSPDTHLQEPTYINPRIQFFTKRAKVNVTGIEVNKNYFFNEIKLEDKGDIQFPGIYFTEELYEKPINLVSYTEVNNNKKELFINTTIEDANTSFALLVILNDNIIFNSLYQAKNSGLLSLPITIENLTEGNNELYTILALDPYDMQASESNLSVKVSNKVNIHFFNTPTRGQAD